MDIYNYITAEYDINICYADVYSVDIDENEISEYRKNRINAIKSETALKQSIGAEAVLVALAKKTNITKEFPLEYNADISGKPKFVNDNRIHFSLSHSGKFAACAMAKMPIGIDVQMIKKPNLQIAKKYFTDNELKLNDGSEKWFMRIWARKEAVVKAEGSGISIGLSKIDVSCNNVKLNDDEYYVEDIAIQNEKYCMAVAVKLT